MYGSFDRVIELASKNKYLCFHFRAFIKDRRGIAASDKVTANHTAVGHGDRKNMLEPAWNEGCSISINTAFE